MILHVLCIIKICIHLQCVYIHVYIIILNTHVLLPEILAYTLLKILAYMCIHLESYKRTLNKPTASLSAAISAVAWMTILLNILNTHWL